MQSLRQFLRQFLSVDKTTRGERWGVVMVVLAALLAATFGLALKVPGITRGSPAPPWIRTNILGHSDPIAISQENISTCYPDPNPESDDLAYRFSNSDKSETGGSGVAFKFTDPPDVTGLDSVVIRGTSRGGFHFEIEYKVNDAGDHPVVVEYSGEKEFPSATSWTATVPMKSRKGTIDELAINFTEPGESSDFAIESIRLEGETHDVESLHMSWLLVILLGVVGLVAELLIMWGLFAWAVRGSPATKTV